MNGINNSNLAIANNGMNLSNFSNIAGKTSSGFQ